MGSRVAGGFSLKKKESPFLARAPREIEREKEGLKHTSLRVKSRENTF